MSFDFLDKLRTPAPTPDDEVCHCGELRRLMLRATFSPNPISCLECTGEVALERLSLTTEAVEAIAGWLRVYEAIYSLWLDSGSYEAWARVQLKDSNGEANRRGLKAACMVSDALPTFFWWFFENPPGPNREVPFCPNCQRGMAPHPTRDFFLCEDCRIAG